MSLAPESFRPGANSGRLDVTAASKSLALPGGGGTLEVINTSATLIVFYVTGVGAQVAAIPADTASGPGWAVGPLQTKRIRISPLHDTLAAISTAAGPSTILVSRGDGV